MWLIVNRRRLLALWTIGSELKSKGETGRHQYDLSRPNHYGAARVLSYAPNHPNQVHR